MENFALDSIKIKSNWFDGEKKSVFQQIGKEEGLNLYLQLFRFRVHQGNLQEHYFITSINELSHYTKINMKRNLTKKKVFDLLCKLHKQKIIDPLNFKTWDRLIDDQGNILGDKLLKLKASDIPQITKKLIKENKDGTFQTQDECMTKEDYYIPVVFDLVNYIYSKGLYSKTLSIYFLIRKWANGNIERKAYPNINTIESWLGYGRETVLESIKELNRHALIYTVVKKQNGKDKFEHYPLIGNLDKLDRFKKVNI